MKIKTFLIKVPEDIWNRWKNTIPRSKSLHQALIEILEKEAKK